MKKLRWLAVAGWLGMSGFAHAGDKPQPQAGVIQPTQPQSGVPNDFTSPFPFAPKPKPSLGKRLWNKLLHPFRHEPEPPPPGSISLPGMMAPNSPMQNAQMPKK